MPLANIIEKIHSEKKISIDKINTMISKKMTELAGLVSPEGAAHIIANELGVNIFSEEPQEIKISDIKPFMKHITVTGKVLALFDLIEFQKESNPGKVRTAIIGDETGRIKVSFWHSATDPLNSVSKGDILRLKDGASRENNGAVEMSISTPESIQINPEGISIEVLAEKPAPKKKIVELTDENRATISGVIVQAFKPAYYITCPECRRKLKDGACIVHGKKEPALGYVFNAIIDDGTDTMRCVLFNETANTITNFAAIEKDDTAQQEIIKKIIGTIVQVTGAIRVNQLMGRKEIIASSITVLQS